MKVQEETKQVIRTLEDNKSSDGSDAGEDLEMAIDETIVGKGLGNALKVLRERGLLGKGLVRGRNMDKTVET